MGDLPWYDSYYNPYTGPGFKMPNVIQSGERIGDVTLHDRAELENQGLNLNLFPELGDNIFGFSFQKPAEMTGDFFATILEECLNDGMTLSGEFVTNNAPTLTNIDSIQGIIGNQPFTMTYEDLLAASNATDTDGDEISFIIQSVNAGNLTKDGQSVISGVTTLSLGESLIGEYSENDFRQATNFSLPAFSITATDGVQESQTPVDVTLNSTVYLTQPPLNQFSLSTSDDLTLSIKGNFPTSGWTLNPIIQERNGDTFNVEVTALAPYISSGEAEEFSKTFVLASDIPKTGNYSYKAVINDTSSVTKSYQTSLVSAFFSTANSNTSNIVNINNIFSSIHSL